MKSPRRLVPAESALMVKFGTTLARIVEAVLSLGLLRDLTRKQAAFAVVIGL